ncbi:hypothetical protein SHI21_11370 [Bacteriovorax sp. PP10]|uniref:Hook-length control protein FliK n=1 Tax=Bacteriovorax antarcticus TaxID=3088717 RepID=A0ABU5VUU1_9BACT|nr:hypothetical protein [Bacteriovorax sp. PP10]MEA9356811.1 hypothetical protein [Bacteriovorax sp. PP10]
MQGLPTNLLTKTAAVAAGKVESNSAVNVNGKVGAITGKESKESSTETKSGFAEIFSGLLGNAETKVEGKTEGKAEGEEGKTPANAAEVKLDALLKTKEQEKNQKAEVGALSTEKALSPEVLKNINNLINRAPIDDTKVEGQIGEKIAATSSNLDQLLKTLKGDNAEVQIEGEVVSPEALKENQKAKAGSPLDFLLKESKSSDVGMVDSKESKLLQTNPEMVSKLGLSSEDFLSHKADAKDAKLATSDKTMNLDGEFDLKAFGQKQMNQSMKAYGQKQNLLNDGVIRNTKDLAFGEKKVKAGESELITPDMKIGADLSHMKDQFIPLVQKQEMAAQGATTQGSEKVLDLSKINTSNTTEIIKKISDYIEQSQVANSNTMDLTVKHEALGQFKIQVNRPIGPGNQMDMQITTTTAEGHDFFMKNEIGLMKNLSQAGIQLSDLRIVSGGEGASLAGDSRQQNNNSQSNSQAGREFMSFDSAGDSSHGADRRKELWQEARNNQMRYGA